MRKSLPNFIRSFNLIGDFLVKFDQFMKMRSDLKSPDAFVKKFDDLFKGHSPSADEEALAAYDEIVATIYGAGCSSGPTRMRG